MSFIDPKQFSVVFNRLCDSLRPQGVFAGNFFGDKDDWALTEHDKTFFSTVGLHELLKDVAIIKCEEIENDNGTALGAPKHWHVFNVIAQKN